MAEVFKLPLPVQGRITSGFGLRKAPNKLASTNHKGIDIAASLGTPVKAPMDGVATILPFNEKGGNILLIKHNARLQTKYFHLSGFNVTEDQQVKKGDVVAFTGQTGNATGPHLHYEVIVDGEKVDPLGNLELGTIVNVQENIVTSHGQEQPNIVVNQKEYTDFITVDDKYIDSLDKFIEKYDIAITADELLTFKNNRESIFKSYTKEQATQYKTANKDVINIGTIIEVPLNKVKSNNPYRVNQTLNINKTYNAFIEYEIKKLLYNPDYVKLNTVNFNNGRLLGNTVKGNVQVSVWLWSKTLSLDGGFLIDISPFIKNIVTNVGPQGGNFSISLPHITYKRVNDGNDFDIDINNYVYYNSSDFVSKNVTHEQVKLNSSTEYFKRKNSFFNDVISVNDVLFIRFEPLKIDNDGYTKKNDFIKINPSELPGKVFDMIALVDEVAISADAANNTQNITVSGRDLMKMVIDDSVYFFPIQYAVQNSEQIIKNSGSKSAKRLTLPDNTVNNSNIQFNIEGGIIPDIKFNFDVTQTVEDWLIFIFSQLTNLDICPDNLLKFYKDKTFIVSRSDNFDSQGSYGYKRLLANGLWQIVKLVVDSEISSRRLADASLATDTGSLLNMIRKVCQDPFIDFDSDTFGDKFYFKVRKPPFAEQSYKSNYTIDIYEDDVYGDNLWYNDQAYSFYRLTPMGSLLDANDGASMILIPAVHLPQFAEIWGNKVLDIQSNFLDFDFSVSNESNSNLENIITQGKQDLDWLIETHCYLPFTRMGNIIIKGDRRFKRGMNIRYRPTGELFYVESVNNVGVLEGQTQRTTTLAVSHGIVEKHYDKYFKIVNLLRNNPVDLYNKNMSNQTWTVNNDIFRFFLSRQQWV